MLLVLGRLTVSAEVMDDYEADLAAMIPRVLKEDGCNYYSLIVEDKTAGIVAVAEMWRDEAALLTHFGQPWIVDFVEKYGRKILASTLRVYDADNERDLPSA